MREKISGIGALISAAFASVCCLGPIVLVGLGLGSVGLAAGLVKYRSIFLVLTAVLLAVAFYFTYRKKERACPDGSCDQAGAPAKRDGEEVVEARQSGNREFRSGSKPMKTTLWIITAITIGVAAFPTWSCCLLPKKPSVTASVNTQTVVLAISGVHCSACAGSIKKALLKVVGVQSASVDFDKAEAKVWVKPGQVSHEALLGAVQAAGGYTAEIKK